MSTPTATWAGAAGAQHKKTVVRTAKASAATLNMTSPSCVRNLNPDNLGSIIPRIKRGKVGWGVIAICLRFGDFTKVIGVHRRSRRLTLSRTAGGTSRATGRRLQSL
jgi:hypothetical protein